MKPALILALLVSVPVLAGCSGIQTDASTFTAHAESFALLGLEIPRDDRAAAHALVPEGAAIETVYSTPDDWTSIAGFFSNLLSIQVTQISGTLPE